MDSKTQNLESKTEISILPPYIYQFDDAGISLSISFLILEWEWPYFHRTKYLSNILKEKPYKENRYLLIYFKWRWLRERKGNVVHSAEGTTCLKTEAGKASGTLSRELQVVQHGFM